MQIANCKLQVVIEIANQILRIRLAVPNIMFPCHNLPHCCVSNRQKKQTACPKATRRRQRRRSRLRQQLQHLWSANLLALRACSLPRFGDKQAEHSKCHTNTLLLLLSIVCCCCCCCSKPVVLEYDSSNQLAATAAAPGLSAKSAIEHLKNDLTA